MGSKVRDTLCILGGVAALAVILFAFPETEQPEILYGHSFQIENNGLYLANIPTKIDGVTYYDIGWGPKSQARSYGAWIRAYEDFQEWGGRIVIQRYEPVTPEEKELP